MQKFLKQVAIYLINNYGNDIGSLRLVFPNRRASLFFQKYLSAELKQPVISPEIITISQLTSNFTNLQLADTNALVIELYKTFCDVTKSNEPIDEFFFWGELLLNDFNDIDKYLVNSDQLFKNIHSLREIDLGFDYLSNEQIQFLSSFWNAIIQSRNTQEKDSFLSIWKHLPTIYKQFKQKLFARGIAYEGMIYREIVEQLNDKLPTIEHTYGIIGFNALNMCEKKLFSYFQTSTETMFFWDFDEYYKDNIHHEAGSFIRENLSNYAMPEDFQLKTNSFAPERKINLVSVPGGIGQTMVAANWLTENKNNIQTEFDDTAIVLCDEELLPHLLNVLPDSQSDINITMGYPLKNSPAFSLIKTMADVDANCRKDENNETFFFYRYAMALMNHSLIKPLVENAIIKLNRDILEQNKIYLVKSDFNISSLLSQLFSIPETTREIGSYLQSIIHTVFTATENDLIIKESLYQLNLAINRLDDSLINTDQQVVISKKLYYKLLLRQLERITIPFEGEPLKGLQIMGFLETRCLDFKNIILLSFNDQKLPGNQHNHSFIPYNLRRGFGLPLAEHHNAMYSYYFYRLIQRAENLTLVYDSRTDGMTNGEVSRFATQLKYEANHIEINNQQTVFNYLPTETKTIEIEKDKNVMQALLNYIQNKPLSPSALDKYIECSLRFYFQYIEKVRETEEIYEDINHLLFGRIAHLVLEELYKPYIGIELTKENIESLLKDKTLLDKTLAYGLKEEFFKGKTYKLQGKNLLVYDVIKKYIIRILKYDASIAPFEIIGLEKSYYRTFKIDDITIKLGGIIDRLDKVNGRIRVVDYKTGQSDTNVSNIDGLFKSSTTRNKAAFQTMLYAMCVSESKSVPISPAVYGTRNVFQENFHPILQLNDNDLIYQANALVFENKIEHLLKELLNPQIPFEQTANQQKCKTCAYNVICNRS